MLSLSVSPAREGAPPAKGGDPPLHIDAHVKNDLEQDALLLNKPWVQDKGGALMADPFGYYRAFMAFDGRANDPLQLKVICGRAPLAANVCVHSLHVPHGVLVAAGGEARWPIVLARPLWVYDPYAPAPRPPLVEATATVERLIVEVEYVVIGPGHVLEPSPFDSEARYIAAAPEDSEFRSVSASMAIAPLRVSRWVAASPPP